MILQGGSCDFPKPRPFPFSLYTQQRETEESDQSHSLGTFEEIMTSTFAKRDSFSPFDVIDFSICPAGSFSISFFFGT